MTDEGENAEVDDATAGESESPEVDGTTTGEPVAQSGGAPSLNVAEWHGRMLVDVDGQRIGKLEDVYVDVENDVPQFATVKEGFISRHLTFVPLGGVTVGPNQLQAAVTKQRVESAPNIEQHGEGLSQSDESALYHHYELTYTPPNTESGRRLARR
jgi:hypothetical protein